MKSLIFYICPLSYCMICMLLKSNEVGASSRMEKEGLERSLALLDRHSINIDVLITDRHSGINKMMREDHPEITHLFDIWHLAKG